MITAVVVVLLSLISGITIFNVIDSTNNRKKYEAAARVDIAKIEYNRLMGIIEEPRPDIKELREKRQEEQMSDIDIVDCPTCKGQCTIPNYNNTEEDDCGRCDGSGELRWDHFEADEKRKYLAG